MSQLRPTTWLPLALGATLAGCAAPDSVELLEAQLRQQEDRLIQLERELSEARRELQVARQDAEGLRVQLTGTGRTGVLPEQADVLYRAAGMKFNTLLTGGQDVDGNPGDEALNVVLIPHDADGDLLKLAGEIRLDVLDLSLPDDKQRIGRWEYSAKESREHWHSGFLGTGLQFRVPWQTPPQSGELLLHARLTTPDGRQFDASQPIRVTPPQSVSRETIAEGNDDATTAAASEPEASEPSERPPKLLPVADEQEAADPELELPPFAE